MVNIYYKQSILAVVLFLCATGAAHGQLRLNEVGYSGVDVQGESKWVEIFNGTESAVDVSSYWLCNFPSYAQISTLTVLEGNTTIPAGGYLVVAFDAIGDGDGEVGLYQANNFGSPADILDYLQYGSAGHQREPVAAEAGLWDPGAFVAAAPAGQSLSFFDNGGAPADNWASADPSAGQENPSAVAGGARLNEVGYSGVDVQGESKWVEIFNGAEDAIDVSSYWLCNFPSYAQISTLTVLEGNTTIPAGGYLVVAFDAIGDGDGEVGLYQANNFGSAADMLDYLQYGSAGHQREPVAVEAGLWDAGAFVAAAPAGQSLSFFDNGGAPADNWTATEATAGNENMDNVSTPVGKEANLPGSFSLLGHYPEPFNPSTTILFNLREAATVQVVVYDLLGQEVLRSNEQPFAVGENQAFPLEAGTLSSGIYVYRVTARGSRQTAVQTGRMTLLK